MFGNIKAFPAFMTPAGASDPIDPTIVYATGTVNVVADAPDPMVVDVSST